jgi:hypothetical protein
MTRFWSEEKPMGTGDELSRVKVVGSIPADPTTIFLGDRNIKKANLHHKVVEFKKLCFMNPASHGAVG